MRVIPFNRPTSPAGSSTTSSRRGRGQLAGNGRFTRPLPGMAGGTHSARGASCSRTRARPRWRWRRSSATSARATRSSCRRSRSSRRPTRSCCAAPAGLRRHPARHAQPRRAAGRGGASRRGPGRSSPCTTPASPARWTPLRDSPTRHGLLVVEDAAQALPPPTTAGRSARSATWPPQLPRDEELDLRRGRRAARQRSGARRARRDRPREGHQPQPFFRGEVDKYTWVDIGSSYVPSEIPRPSCTRSSSRPRRSRPSGGDLAALPRRARAARARGLAPPADRARRTATHNGHMFYVLLPSRASATRSSATCSARGHPRGLPLRAAALLAGRPPVRPRCLVHAGHRRLQRPDQHQALRTLGWHGTGRGRLRYRRACRLHQLGGTDLASRDPASALPRCDQQARSHRAIELHPVEGLLRPDSRRRRVRLVRRRPVHETRAGEVATGSRPPTGFRGQRASRGQGPVLHQHICDTVISEPDVGGEALALDEPRLRPSAALCHLRAGARAAV